MAEKECVPDYDCRDYFKEAVCIDAQRVYDSCSDKDCLEGTYGYCSRRRGSRWWTVLPMCVYGT